MDERLKHILEGSLQTFMSLGLRSVTMDDIATRLGVSKKTLYRYVKDKEDLIKQSMELFHQQECNFIESVKSQDLNAIDENFEISKKLIAELQNIHPSVLFDMNKYYPEVRTLFENYKLEVVFEWVKDNLQRGIKEGLYRDDMDVDIISALYILRMDDVFNMEFFPRSNYSFLQVYLETFRYHIRGIASDEGLKYWKKRIKEFNY